MLAAWVRRNWRQLVSVCRRDAVALEDPADRRGAYAVAECEQLALDSDTSPAWVLPRHAHYQGGEGVVDGWSSGPVGVGPLSADEATVPAQDRVRGDQALPTQCARQTAARERRTRPGLPSRYVASGSCGAAPRPRVAVRVAQRPWCRTCGPSVGPNRAPVGRPSTASA